MPSPTWGQDEPALAGPRFAQVREPAVVTVEPAKRSSKWVKRAIALAVVAAIALVGWIQRDWVSDVGSDVWDWIEEKSGSGRESIADAERRAAAATTTSAPAVTTPAQGDIAFLEYERAHAERFNEITRSLVRVTDSLNSFGPDAELESFRAAVDTFQAETTSALTLISDGPESPLRSAGIEFMMQALAAFNGLEVYIDSGNQADLDRATALWNEAEASLDRHSTTYRGRSLIFS